MLNLVLLVFANLSSANQCTDWFTRGKISPGQDCEIKCATLPIDMGTFNCPNECKNLCKPQKKSKIAAELANLYPGLTQAEKDLATTHPIQLLAAYKLSWEAEAECINIYSHTKTNDASDACRHFVWAALLTQELGKSLAETILDAHEKEPTQPENEKAMDLSNNRRGISIAEDLIKNKTFSKPSVITQFQSELKNGNLIILDKTKSEAK